MSEKDQEFYVHRKGTFTGNAPSFWAKGGAGYTCYINGAERFSAEEANKLYQSDPNKWELFSCDAVDARLHLVFDIQDKKRLGTDLPCGHKFGYANTAELTAALTRMLAMHELMMKKVNHGASFYDAECLKEMNEAPIQAQKALLGVEP